jgi:hypothetical protein
MICVHDLLIYLCVYANMNHYKSMLPPEGSEAEELPLRLLEVSIYALVDPGDAFSCHVIT